MEERLNGDINMPDPDREVQDNDALVVDSSSSSDVTLQDSRDIKEGRSGKRKASIINWRELAERKAHMGD